jgi:hypothetical protein
VSDQHHTPAVLYSQGKNSQYPLYRRLGWPHCQSRGKILCLCWESNPSQPVDRQHTDWATEFTVLSSTLCKKKVQIKLTCLCSISRRHSGWEYNMHLAEACGHTWRISWSMFAQASLIRVLSSCSVVGSGGMYTLSFTKPHKKKSRSDYLGGHSIGPPRPTQRLRRRSSRLDFTTIC